MKTNLDLWSIVLVGKWNRYIFSPQWTANNIFDESEVEVEIAMNMPAPHRYTSKQKNIRLIPDANRMVFHPLTNTQACLKGVELCALKLIEKLPHTPMIAFGINFGFIETDNKDLLDVFNLPDNGKLTKNDVSIASSQVLRTLKICDKAINLKMNWNGSNEILIELNFHYPVESALKAADLLRDKVVADEQKALELLKSAYGLELEV